MFTTNDLQKYKRLKSADINRYFQELYSDINDLYQKVTVIKSEQDALRSLIDTSDDSVNQLVNDIQARLDENEDDTIIRTLYSTRDIIFPTKTGLPLANVELSYGTATLKINSQKRYLVQVNPATGETAPISNIKDYLEWYSSNNRISTNISEIIESDISNAFDPNPNKVYIRKVSTYSEAVSQSDILLNISMPEKSLVNRIKIHPYPEGTVDIAAPIFATDALRDQYFVKANGTIYDDEIQSARKMAFSFKEEEISELRMLVKQRNRKYSNPYSFFVGIHSLSIEYNSYENMSYIGFQLTRPEDINYIEQVFTNLDEEDFEYSIDYYIYTDRDAFNNITTDYIYSTETSAVISPANPLAITTSTDTIYVLVKMQKNEDKTSPELNYIVMKWR